MIWSPKEDGGVFTIRFTDKASKIELVLVPDSFTGDQKWRRAFDSGYCRIEDPLKVPSVHNHMHFPRRYSLDCRMGGVARY